MKKSIFIPVLLINSAIVITLFLLHKNTSAEFLRLDIDHSLGEIYETILLIASSFLIYKFLYLPKRKNIFIPVLLLFVYMVLDSLFSLHEMFGVVVHDLTLIQNLAGELNVNNQAAAELLYFSIIGISFLVSTLALILKASLKDLQKLFFILSGVAVIFLGGIVVDFIRDIETLDLGGVSDIGLLEDFLELLGIVLSFQIVFLLTHKDFATKFMTKKKT
jgi:hypothetical protein